MKKIVVVDNHPVMLKFLDNLLTKLGHRVMTAKDGLDALDILKDFIPDVMFIDLIMPNIGGKKLCKIIRTMSEFRNTFLIIFSAIAAEENGRNVNFSEFGANACIAKGPFDKMKKHVITALSQADQGALYAGSGEIMGLEDIHIRSITNELLSGKQHYEFILNAMTEGIFEITSRGRIVYANPSAVTLSGLSEEKLLAANFTDLLTDTDRTRIDGFMTEAARTPDISLSDDMVMLNDRQVALKMRPLLEEDLKYVIIMNDVTDQQQREFQIRHAQKMEAIGTLAGGIAHDFNNLLMGIQGNVSLIRMDTDTTYPHHQRLEIIDKLITRGAKLTSQLLGYAREGRYELMPLNLNQLVEETSETIARTRKDIIVHLDLAADLALLTADRGQIEQVLLNLYVNASDAMPTGGNLYIKTAKATHADMQAHPYTPKPGKYTLLIVTDSGIGIADDILARIFDPFFTTKEMGRSTGLSLAAVYGIVKGHGGYIDVESEKNKGTTFRIYLPSDADRKEPFRDHAGVSDTTQPVRTVLLVDDEDHILEIGTDMLHALGYHVLTAQDGLTAIELYKTHGPSIDVVLLDMVMPQMGGGEIFNTLKSLDPDVRVLLSSGYSLDGKAAKIMDRGCDGFVQKPFRIEDLSESIMAILNKG
jgi:two-component system cell cycle sensor histidine kinase/response regulator CckA